VTALGQLSSVSSTTTPFDRVGGFDVVARAVGRFIARLTEVPSLSVHAASAAREDTRWRFQLLITDLLGGPMAYEGPDPAELRHAIRLDAAAFDAGVTLLTACFVDVGAPSGAVDELRTTFGAFGRRLGLAATVGTADPRPRLIARAKALVEERQLDGLNLFVLDAHHTVVYVSPEATRAVQAVDADLRRAFGLSAAELPNTSFLRFHPAPTQFQGLLTDRNRLPRETTWCFGRNTWKANLLAVEGDDGALLGYAIAWHDESEASRVAEVFRRLRADAEELPVPLMYPSDTSCETWHGNAACEVALERLAPHLPSPVNPLEGLPASLFFPDPTERKALFRDPDKLPHKRQVRFGPETVSILVSPVRDQEQRFLGPQITWEIVYFTRADEVPLPPVVPSAAAPAPESEALAQLLELSPSTTARSAEPGPVAAAVADAPLVDGAEEGRAAPPTQADVIRGNARILEQAGKSMQQLAALLESVAQLTAQGLDDTAVASAGDRADAEGISRDAEAAQEALSLAREAGGRPEVDQALQWLEQLARQTNLLAVQAAAEVLREDATAAGEALHAAVQGLTDGMAERVDSVTALAQGTAQTLHAAGVRAARVRALRSVLQGGPAVPPASPTGPARCPSVRAISSS
jgi:truncated hemoglobin YjbI